jgi:hypothetical protein
MIISVLQLAVAGLSSQIYAWVASQAELVLIAFNKSATFRGDDEILQQGFAALGFTSEQVDGFFRGCRGTLNKNGGSKDSPLLSIIMRLEITSSILAPRT